MLFSSEMQLPIKGCIINRNERHCTTKFTMRPGKIPVEFPDFQ